MAAKKKIEEIQGKDSYPRGQQMLIYKGKVLKDESTLDENEVTEDEFLVLMLSKSKASASSGASSAQIMAVKKKIEEIQGKDSYPRGQQILIYKGKVLKDESTLDENEVTEDAFLVVMPSKSKASASSGASSAQPLSTPVSRQAPPIAQPQAPQPIFTSCSWNQANPSRCFVASPVVQGVHQQAEGRPPKILARAAGGVGRKDVRRSGRGHRGAAMKLTVKILKGIHFQIRVQHHDTVRSPSYLLLHL
ncbi:hypothetical protein ACQ4PT_026199 [Festuca glaucescens]